MQVEHRFSSSGKDTLTSGSSLEALGFKLSPEVQNYPH